LQEFEKDFFACPMNTEGHTFQCVFCSDYFITESERKNHLKETSVGDALNEEHIYSETIK
jgi:hypothetical protein